MYATATNGFLQKVPELGDSYKNNVLLQRLIQRHVSSPSMVQEIDRDLSRFSSVVLPVVAKLGEEAERNPPALEGFDAWCRPTNTLHISSAWKKLKEIAAKEGLVSIGYARERYGSNARIFQMAKSYLFTPDSAVFNCPLSMTDGAVRVIEQFGDASLKAEILPKLLSNDSNQFWTSGQWMTERPGGSDVSQSETKAEFEPDQQWSIHGFKWFSSATDADMTLLLARTRNPATNQWIPNSPGLSLFWAPMRKPCGSLNGIRIHRLKQKFGTRAVPTAELELSGMRARMLGSPGKGVKTISVVLNITRIYCAFTSAAYMQRGLEMAKAYAKVRLAQGKPLAENSLHMRNLAAMEVNQNAALILTFYVISLLGRQESLKCQKSELLLRFLTPVTKMWVCKITLGALSECMEAMGGQGYMEDVGLTKLYRDAQVNSIWEGTTNIMGLDVIRILSKDFENTWNTYKKAMLELLEPWRQSSQQQVLVCEQGLSQIETFIKANKNDTTKARELGFAIAQVTAAVLLVDFSGWSGQETVFRLTMERFTKGLSQTLSELAKSEEGDSLILGWSSLSKL